MSQFLIGKIAVEGLVIIFRIIHHICHRVKGKITKAPEFGFEKYGKLYYEPGALAGFAAYCLLQIWG